MKINEHIIPISKARSGRKLRKFSGVTIHETGNFSKGANAKSHDRYMHINGGKNTEVSYQYVVDDVEVYHLIPDNEVAWHAGDGGSGRGNCETIAIEICVNPDSDLAKARENAMWLAAKILRDHGIAKVIDGTKNKANGNLFQHNTFSSYGKNCPRIIRDNALWNGFVEGVRKYLGQSGSGSVVPNNDIAIRSIVKVTGEKYVTGQIIPAWVKNTSHIVSKIDGNKVLLGADNGINSWVYLNDIVLAR